jgi:glycosyltransferase involved in cell wall biosynthesis
MNIILRGQLKFLNQYFQVIGATGFDQKHFVEIGKREGIKMINVEMARDISPLKDLAALWKLFKVFQAEKPLIVHTQTPKAGLLGMVAARLAGVPIRLHTVGGLPLLGASGLKRKVLNAMERITYSCAHKVYPNSKGLKNIILDLNFCNSRKLKVLANGGSNGVDTDYFYPEFDGDPAAARRRLRQQYNVDLNDFVFLFVGRIAREKGIEELVTSFENLQRQTPNQRLRLMFIGTFEEFYGAIGETLKNRIRNNPGILHLGRFDDVRPFYLISDVYVFPSYREGFPNTLLEAGAMGLPAIATNINGCNEIISEGLNGILIPPQQAQPLETAMKTMIVDEGKRKEIASRSRKVIEEKFKRQVLWHALLEEYEILARSKSTSKLSALTVVDQ